MTKINKIMKGGENIPLYTETSPDWVNSETSSSPYAVNLDVGINEYQFSRPTPDNKFITATGLVDNSHGIEMVGGKSKKNNKKTSSKSIFNKIMNIFKFSNKENTDYLKDGKNLVKIPVKKTVKKTVKDPVKKTVKDPVKKTIKDPVKKTIKDPVKKTVKKPVKKTVKKSI